MPCEFLIRALTVGERAKGDPQDVRDDSTLSTYGWGDREGLPEFIILHVTDAAAAQIQPHMAAVVNTFTHTIQNENANGWRIRIDVNPNIPALYGIDKGVRNELRDLLVDNWGGQVFDYDNVNHEYAVIDFPKPLIYIPTSEEKTLADIKDEVKDKFEGQVFRRRYKFSESDVDQVIAAGGKVDQTFAQVASKVIDRLG